MTLHERSQHLAGMWNARLIEWLFSAQNNNQMQETSWKPLTSSPAFSYLCLCAIDSVMRMRLSFSPGGKGKEKRRGDSEEMAKSGKAGIEEKERENIIQERKGREASRKGRMICGNRVLHLNRKIMKLIGLAAVRSLSLKNSLAIALVVTNKCLCSRFQLLFLPESSSSLDKLKSVSLKTTIKKKKPSTLLKVALKGKLRTRIHFKKSNTITRKKWNLRCLRVGESYIIWEETELWRGHQLNALYTFQVEQQGRTRKLHFPFLKKLIY